jgi:D-alanyl-D-alanine carboxypeptidase/D-alanyl-D-alanine-endopeptidase (penicillin-binding protein 4)
VQVFPPVQFYRIDNRVRTVAPRKEPGRVRIHRDPGGAVVHLWGEIRVNDPGQAVFLAIDDPALFAAKALREALVRRGIGIAGDARSRHAMPFDETPAERSYAFVLASRSSMPLIEDLRVINKVSQNTHAEMVVREVARQRRGVGSLEASLAEMNAFLKEIGITKADIDLRDGSGLSRMNLVSPDAIVKLLVWMWGSPHGELWVDTLPVAGFDGTLNGRFARTPAAERVLAKTGALTHVSALSGYLKTARDRDVAFAILANNYPDQNGPVRRLMDQICIAIVQEATISP